MVALRKCIVCQASIDASAVAPSGRPLGSFCSERCRLVDLGKWLAGDYRVPVDEDPSDDQTQSGLEEDFGDGS